MVRTRFGGLRARLTVAFVGVALVGIVALGALTLLASRREVQSLVERQREQDSSDIAAAIAQAYDEAGGWEGADLRSSMALTAAAQGSLIVLDRRGEVVAASESASGMSELVGRMHGETQAAPLGPARTSTIEVGGDAVGSAQLRFPDSGIPAPARGVRDALARTVLLVTGFSVVVAAAVAVVISRRLATPLVALTAAVQRLGSGDRRARVELRRAPAEIGELARAFDRMAEDLQREDELRRAVVADVAHELRTPTTILQASSEELADGLAEPTHARLASLHEEVLRLGRVIEDLESLASAEAAALRLDRRLVDLASVSARAVELLRPRFGERGVAIETDLREAVVLGDETRLHQISVNLLTNALKFTPPGGLVAVRVAAENRFAVLEVRDTGTGLTADEVPHVFERFWRGRSGAGQDGSGIGLAVVAELVRAHDGTVTVDSRPDEGATFRVELPMS